MFAGLGLFACNNNDDIVEGGKIEGPADVVVKIDLPNVKTRTVTDPTPGNNSGDKANAVVDKIYVTLNASKGKETKVLEGNNVTPVVFSDVEGPSNVVVSVNYDHRNGDYTFNFEDANATEVGLKTPMYGENNEFIQSEGKATIEVEVKHLLARMEFSGIKHEHKPAATDCIFNEDKLVLAGSFLKGVGTVVSSWEGFINSNWDQFGGSFKVGGTVYPTENKCIAYNIEETTFPIFSLAFDGVEYSEEYSEGHDNIVWAGNSHGYAYVSTYKINKGALTDDDLSKFDAQATDVDGVYSINKFPAGYIYKVTELAVPDEAIHPTIDGKGIEVTATVKILPWTVVLGEVEWQE